MISKKGKIIQSALFLFARHGYTETSIDKIAQHAKVSKGLTYTHFKNKEDLLNAVIQSSITQITDEMMDVKEMSLGYLFDNFFNNLRKNKEVIRLCFLLVIHPETPAIVNELIENQKKDLLKLIGQLLEEKSKTNCLQDAILLLATMDGITLDYMVNPDDQNLKSIEEYLKTKYA